VLISKSIASLKVWFVTLQNSKTKGMIPNCLNSPPLSPNSISLPSADSPSSIVSSNNVGKF
jgi:hypothetical protein